MIINRHNYEEFFLLYVDNELPAAERKAVEAFVQENKDLASELEMLQQAILSPGDPVVFEAKDQLFKNSNAINLDNCETYFLLDVDNELDAEQQSAVEKFVLQHPQVQATYTQLQAAKLPVEEIEFPYKDSLYKTTQRRIVPLRWMSMAAAAAFLGIVGLLYTVIPAGNDVNGPGRTIAVTPNSAKQPIIHSPAITGNDEANNTTTGSTGKDQQATSNETADVMKGQKEASEQAIAQNAPAIKKNAAPDTKNATNPAVAKQQPNASTIPSINQEELLVASTPAETSNDDVAANINPKHRSSLNPVNVVSNDSEPESPLVRQAVYKELDTESDYDENSFLFGSTKINKNKLRGLLKKATNLFDKKAPSDEKERPIQIASFEIKGK